MAFSPRTYATAQEYKSARRMRQGAVDDGIEDDLEVCSRYIDEKARRTFALESEATERLFYPGVDTWIGPDGQLYISDIGDLEGLVIKIDRDNDGDFDEEDELLDGTDYRLGPANVATLFEPQPWRELWIPASSPTWGGWDFALDGKGYAVSITARWGWPAPPSRVKRGTINVCSILRLESPFALRTAGGVDPATVLSTSARANEVVDRMLDGLRLRSLP